MAGRHSGSYKSVTVKSRRVRFSTSVQNDISVTKEMKVERKLTSLEQNLQDDPTCYRCSRALPPGEEGYPAQRRGCLEVHLIGGYGQFHDMIELDDIIETYLCHDCSVELFRFMGFNPRTQTDMRGLHSYDKVGEPCCEFGWSALKNFGANDGTKNHILGYEGDGGWE